MSAETQTSVSVGTLAPSFSGESFSSSSFGGESFSSMPAVSSFEGFSVSEGLATLSDTVPFNPRFDTFSESMAKGDTDVLADKTDWSILATSKLKSEMKLDFFDSGEFTPVSFDEDKIISEGKAQVILDELKTIAVNTSLSDVKISGQTAESVKVRDDVVDQIPDNEWEIFENKFLKEEFRLVPKQELTDFKIPSFYQTPKLEAIPIVAAENLIQNEAIQQAKLDLGQHVVKEAEFIILNNELVNETVFSEKFTDEIILKKDQITEIKEIKSIEPPTFDLEKAINKNIEKVIFEKNNLMQELEPVSVGKIVIEEKVLKEQSEKALKLWEEQQIVRIREMLFSSRKKKKTEVDEEGGEDPELKNMFKKDELRKSNMLDFIVDKNAQNKRLSDIWQRISEAFNNARFEKKGYVRGKDVTKNLQEGIEHKSQILKNAGMVNVTDGSFEEATKEVEKLEAGDTSFESEVIMKLNTYRILNSKPAVKLDEAKGNVAKKDVDRVLKNTSGISLNNK